MDRVSIYCPFCHRHTALSIGLTEYQSRYDTSRIPAAWKDPYGYNWWIGVCNNCNRPMLVANNGDAIYPTPQPSPTDNRVPEHIRLDLDEAKKCFSIGAYRGCAVLARRSIQSTCMDKGSVKGNLRDQIDELQTKGIITNDLKEWAHEIRYVGNDAAHPNKETVVKEDAEAILHLCEQFMQVVFVAPALAAELRLARKGN